MSLTAVVEQRLEQGQTASAGTYIELVDMDELDQLYDAYLSLNDRKYGPEEMPAPLTSDEFKRYVRLLHDAIRSTDEAVDAVKEAKDGSVGKSSAMNYLDGLKMFEIQLVAGKLVKGIHKVHSGTITTPSWPMLTALKFHKYQTFSDRMEKVIVALKTWKALGKALFLDVVPMEKRLAMQPEEEVKKKGANKSNNGNREVQLEFARTNMPKADKPAVAANNDDDEDDADNDGTPAPATKKRRRDADAVTINPGARRGNNRGAKKKPSTPATPASTDAGESIQPAYSTASTSNNVGGNAQPSTVARPGTAFTPINRPRLSQPAESSAPAPNAGSPPEAAPSTPSVDMKVGDPGQPAATTPTSGDGRSDSAIFAGLARVDQQATVQSVLAEMRAASEGFDDNSKFPGPLGRPMPQNSTHVPQTAAPGATQEPLPSSQCLLPQQPQQAQPRRQNSPYPNQPPPDYATSQRASSGVQHGIPQRDNPFLQMNQQHQMQGTRPNTAQSPRHRQAPPHDKVNDGGIQGQCTIHRGQQTTSLQNEGQFSGKMSNGPMAVMRQTNAGPGAISIHNYFQAHTPSPFASPPNGVDRAPGTYFSWRSFGNLEDNQDAWNGGLSTRSSPQGHLSSESPTVHQKVEQQDEEQQDRGQQDQSQQDQRGSSTPATRPLNYPSQATALAAYDRPVASPTTTTIVSQMRLEDMDPIDAAAIIDCRRVAYGLRPLYTVDTESADGDSEPNDGVEETSGFEANESSDGEVKETSDHEVNKDGDNNAKYEEDSTNRS